MSNTFEKLREAVATTLKVPVNRITETTTENDLASWDSLGHLNLMMTLEQTFDVQLEVEDFSRLTSIPAILDYLKSQGIA
jgi:acyl carrier protein